MRFFLSLLLMLSIGSGCTIKNTAKGEYYLLSGKYEEGARSFQNQLRQNPNDPAANYYLGCCLLELDRPMEAKPYLERAVQLNPTKADAHYRLGQAYYGLGQTSLEQKSYEQAIALDSKHIEAHLYLGHILLQKGKWDESLRYYDRVLTLQPENPQALYNRGLALQKMGRVPEEAAAWKAYLYYYPEGKWAIQATDHLNARGDFEYRNFTIGYRRFSVEKVRFKPFSAELEGRNQPSLDRIGEVLAASRNSRLQITVYQENNPKLAEARAQSVKGYLAASFSSVDPARINALGIGRQEKVRVGSKRFTIDESVTFATKRR